MLRMKNEVLKNVRDWLEMILENLKISIIKDGIEVKH